MTDAAAVSQTAGQTPAQTAAERRRWLLLGLIIFAGILNYVDRQVIAVLKPIIEQDMGWSDADYGRLASLFQFSAAIAFLFTGGIVDKLGVKWAAPVGVATWSLAAMAHGGANTMLQFSAARVALGATESMGTPSYVKTIGALFSARMRSVAFGISNGASNVGAIVTPLLLPLLSAVVGWRASFVVVGALGFLWVALWFVSTRGLQLAPDKPVEVAGRPTGKIGLKVLLSDRRTWGVAGAKALSDQVWWLLLFWAPDFFHRVFHVGMHDIGKPLAVVYGFAAVGSVFSGWIASRLLARGLSINTVRKGSMLVCALLVTPVPLAVLVDNYWLAVLLLGLTLAAHQGFSTNMFATIADITPKDRVGSVTSFGAFCGNLAGMGIVLLAGELLQRGAGYLPLLAIAAVSYLIAVAWLQVFVPRLETAQA
ncbi:MFS transporter [Caulobacter sp. D4A]|uniref:MFS transporter n=1 Tax=unclassified Caulobacter TaxID=2648921 RepID=UPI000D729A54|nr:MULTISPECIES: MFS transporter [unclassified Caulobacter]PXA84238.1 MFS transporter [Caulobacter sp. D4A]PXA95991.1 MFS transporter [Caulobacter sp. D5]